MAGERRTRADGAPPAASRGRPLDATRDVVILDAASALLVEVGYDQLSVESVAARAGVGKATIYRRYPNKAALVVAAVEHGAAWAPPDAATGDLREVLLVTVQWLAQDINGQALGLLGALFVGMRTDPVLADGMRRVRARDQAAITAELARRIGGSGPGLRAAELLAEVATAVIVHRAVVGEACDQPFRGHLVDDILLPLLRPRPDIH